MPPLGYKSDELCEECFHQVFRVCRQCGRLEAVNYIDLCDACFDLLYPERHEGKIVTVEPQVCVMCGEYGAFLAIVHQAHREIIPICGKCATALERTYQQLDWHYD